MATVSGITVARAQEIEDNSVVDGSIVGNSLLLETGDGTQINVGAIYDTVPLTTHESDVTTHGVATGEIVGTSKTQTLSGKTYVDPVIQGDAVFSASATVDIPTLAPVQNQNNTTLEVTATTYGTSTDPMTATVVCPPSGAIRVDIFSRMYATANETVWLSFEVRETDGSGTVILAENNARAMQVFGANGQSVAFSYIVDSLTPGTTYFFRLKHKVSSGIGTYGNRVLIVSPSIG